MLSVRVGGVWVQSIGPYAEVAFSHEWPHGSALASWLMQPGTTHPALTSNAIVEILDGGQRIWRGRLSEPSTSGEFNATGLWSDAQGVLALDGAGTAASNTPDTAVDAAISRGALAWTRPATLSSAAWGTASEPLDLLRLLDESMAGLGKRWWVDADGVVRAAADPTTPSYHVPHAVAGRGLRLADDAYYSHLVGYYVSGLDVDGNDVVAVRPPIGSAAAAAQWGRKEGIVDLTAMKVISSGTADTEVTNRLALTGARMGFAEGLELGYGQITTPGGTPVALTMPRAGEMVRLMGVTDPTRAGLNLPYIDIVIGSSSYKEGEGVVKLNPVGMAPRNLTDVLKVAVAT